MSAHAVADIPRADDPARAPAGGVESVSPEEAIRRARAMASSGRENFHVLTSLVPRAMRDDFGAVYAFCRWADDLGDEYTGAGSVEAERERALDRLRWWRGELDACFAGEPRHWVFVALRPTIERCGLPREPFDCLIEAFEQDQRVTSYETWDQLVDYCTRSADPVGRLVLGVSGVEATPERARMSDAICTGLQLANFWQDVRSDLVERGRVYMPSGETGLRAQDLQEMALWGDDPAARVRFIRALRPLVERTRPLFAEGRALAEDVGPEVGPVIGVFRAAGVHVLDAVEGIGCTTLWRRPRVSKATRARLFVRAWLASRLGRRGR